jgi:hypothetical protein
MAQGCTRQGLQTDWLQVGAASTQLLQHTWAPGFLLASVAALNLKDAADRGRQASLLLQEPKLG